MRAEDLQSLLRRQPFVPFRIRLSDGSIYAIGHPEMLWIRRSTVLIGAEAREGAHADYDHDIVNLLHIVRIEQLDGQAKSV